MTDASRPHPACSCGEQDNPPDGRFCITCGKPFARTAGPRRTLTAGAVVALSLILAGGIYLLARFLSPSPASVKPASSGRVAKQSRGGALPDALKRLPAGEAGVWIRRGTPRWERFRTGFGAASSDIPLPYKEEAAELAMVTRGKQLVVLLLGRFDVKANDDALAFLCRRKKVEGVNLWVRIPGGVLRGGRRYTLRYGSHYVARDRVVYGSRDLVLETVKGPSKTFDKTVTYLEREMMAKVGWTDSFSLIRREVRGPVGPPFGRGKVVSTVMTERVEQETTRATAAVLYEDEDAAVSGEGILRKDVDRDRARGMTGRIRRDGRIVVIDVEKHP